MLFNTDKSKIIHFGINNNESSYVSGTSTLCTVDKERDLGVIIYKTLKPSKQCTKAAGAANAVLGMINSPDNSPDEASPAGSASGVFGHQIRLPYGTCRPICSRCLCCPSLCLKQFSEGADTVLSSREFQNSITLSDKKMLA